MKTNEYMSITEVEYNNWFTNKSIKVIESERCIFSSAGSGLHEFSSIIEKDGNQYELFWGWGFNLENLNERHYGIKLLKRSECQEGDGI